MPSKEAIELLRRDSRAWWYHRDLRASGKHSDARIKEHESLRSRIRDLRLATCVGVALNGVWIHGHGWSVSGCSDSTLDVFAVWAPHVPRVDKRNVERIVTYVFLSPIHGEHDEQRCSSMSFVSTGTYLAIWERLGALVHWGSLNPDEHRNKPLVHEHVERMKG